MRVWFVSTLFLTILVAKEGRAQREDEESKNFSLEKHHSLRTATSLARLDRPPNRQSHRRLNCNTDLINSAIALSLPAINTLIRSFTPDPLEIDQDFETTGIITGSGGACDGHTANILTTIENLTGLKTIEITKIEVREGTEQVCCGCPTTFGGTFEFDGKTGEVKLNNNVVITDVTAGACAAETITAVATFSQLAIGGEVTMSGIINNNQVIITDAEIRRLTTACGDVSVAVSDSTSYGNLVPSIQAAIGEETCDTIENFVNGQLIDAINSGINALELNWGFMNSGYYIARFMAANAPNIVRTFVSGELSETMEQRREFLDGP